MDELEKTTPDDFWRKTFDEASETPPPRVWDAIEHRLNESDDAKIIPLWGAGLVSSRPLVWSMSIAASVALVLVGWWLMPASQQSESLPVAQHRVQQGQATQPATNGRPRSTDNGSMSADQSPTGAVQPVERNSTAQPASDRSLSAPTPAVEPTRLLTQLSRIPTEIRVDNRATELAKVSLTSDESAANQRHVSTAFLSNRSASPDVLSGQPSASASFMPVSGKTLRTGRFGRIHRIVWFRPAELPIAPEKDKSKRKAREVWASASVMSVAFNPVVSLRPTAYAHTNNYLAYDAIKNSSASTPMGQSVSSRPNFSMAYQASAGVQLSNRWSIESGVGYLLGRSTVETPTQLPAASFLVATARNAVTTQYTDVLRNSIYTNSLAYSAAPTANTTAYPSNQPTYSGQQSQVLTNDYQYLQVPVQVGYQLRPRKKLSLSVLGGLITNIFVKNTVADEVVVTAKDGIYRPVSLAATVGARFRYRPSQQWSASVAGVYQPSLGLGTQTDSQVQIRPTSAGMSFGVDYHF